MNQSQTKVQSVEISVGTHEFERNLEAGQQNQEQGQEGQNQRPKKMRNLNMNDLDDLQGLMTQEEELVTKMMRDRGVTPSITPHRNMRERRRFMALVQEIKDGKVVDSSSKSVKKDRHGQQVQHL